MGIISLLALGYSVAFIFGLMNSVWWSVIASFLGFGLLLLLSLYVILLEDAHNEKASKQTIELDALKKELEEIKNKLT
jgi:uncharacterized membrane protein YdjX (TVP38/TMEM64 family)